MKAKKQKQKKSNNKIDYKINDILVSKYNVNKEIGVCTGFLHNNTCVEINGKCYGGKNYFIKSEKINNI